MTSSQHVNRAMFLRSMSSLALVAGVREANALASDPANNEIVPGQVADPGKLDVNNSPVADYVL